MKKVIVAGGREYMDYQKVKETLDSLFSEPFEVVCGCQTGADTLGKEYAQEKGYPRTDFPPAWNTYGLAAGPIRNEQMAQYADHLVLFWNGKSKGSRNMLKHAKAYHLAIDQIFY